MAKKEKTDVPFEKKLLDSSENKYQLVVLASQMLRKKRKEGIKKGATSEDLKEILSKILDEKK